MKQVRIVYLLHLDRPVGDASNPRGQARHYMGCTCDLARRMRQHLGAYGSVITAAANAQGIRWRLARTWLGGFDRERALKARHRHRDFCPLCWADKEGVCEKH